MTKNPPLAPLVMMQERSSEFRSIFDSELPFVWRSLRRLGVPERDLPDLVHEVFIAVYRHLSAYDRARPLRPWLFGFACRVASDYRRRAPQRRELFGVEPDTESQVGRGTEDELVARMILAHALNRLDEHKRTLIVLHELEGWPLREIAEAFGVPLQTLYSRLKTAREELELAVREGGARETRRSHGAALAGAAVVPNLDSLYARERHASEAIPESVREALQTRIVADGFGIVPRSRVSALGSMWGALKGGALFVSGGLVGSLITVMARTAPLQEVRYVEAPRTEFSSALAAEPEAPPSPAEVHAQSPPPRVDPGAAPDPPRNGSNKEVLEQDSTGSDTVLRRERALIETARSALLRRDGASGLRALETHAREFPRGRLGEEREALAVQALATQGRADEARRRAQQFHYRYPRSLFAPLVQAALP